MGFAVNIVTLGGNLTRDPELKYAANGTPVCQFGVAVNEVFTRDTGEKVEKCHFFNLMAFGKTAENIAQYFKKGKPILIEGKLQQDQWEDKQTGEKKSAVKVMVNRFHFAGGTKDEEAQPRTPRPAPARRPAPEADPKLPPPEEDNEVPF